MLLRRRCPDGCVLLRRVASAGESVRGHGRVHSQRRGHLLCLGCCCPGWERQLWQA